MWYFVKGLTLILIRQPIIKKINEWQYFQNSIFSFRAGKMSLLIR